MKNGPEAEESDPVQQKGQAGQKKPETKQKAAERFFEGRQIPAGKRRDQYTAGCRGMYTRLTAR